MEKYADQPFVIVGANVGDELADVKRVFDSKKLPWQSFYLGYNYSIVDAFGVQGYPTLFVLDKNLTIQSVSAEIDYRKIEELLQADN